jgi:hypothetical protein
VQNHLEISFLNLFFKILYVFCCPSGNGKCPSTKFLENDEIVFHLAVMSQCEQGGEGHIWDSAYADKVKFTASED